ncbi:hypothetical protein, partial [Campylobacter sp. 1]|uniref:hypothetical protein n=1 Tax=Campylobacter sp. 1 TaxID=2039344 RepID=UPI000BD76A16
ETKINELKGQLFKLETEYMSNGFPEKLLKKMVPIKSEIAELEQLVKQQQGFRDRGEKHSYCEITEEDKQSLIEAFAPIRVKQDELYQVFLEKMSALEETLTQLHDERRKVEDIYQHLYQIIQSNAGETTGR